MTKTSKRSEQRKRARQRQKAELIANVKVPSHIEVVGFDSSEWQDRVRASQLVGGPLSEAYKKARGEAQHLWHGGEEHRQKTFEGIEPDEFIAHVLSLNTDPKMQPIEEKFAKKFGSYKALPYQEWAHKVHDLWMDVEWDPCIRTLTKAKLEVISELKVALLKLTDKAYIEPLTVDEALPKVTKGRNSGWPFFSSKWALKDDMLNYYVEQAEQLVAGVDALKGCPHILFKRVQPNGDTPKMRAVECPPKSEAIAAKCFTDKFIEVFKTMTPYYGFNGGERVHEVLGAFMEKKILVESDFSSFDQRVVHLMPHIFQVISQVVPEQYWQYLWNTLNYYQHAELITPVGILRGKDGRPNGLLSGEGWTSVIGTLANSIAVKYAMMRMGVTDYVRLSFGDDIAIAADEFSVEKFELYMKELGMDCNRSKQNASEGPTAGFSFLGWYHFRDDWKDGCQGKFPMCRIAPGLYYREYWMDVKDVLADDTVSEEAKKLLRQSPIGIDIIALASKLNNCRNNRNFVELVRYVREHSPKKLSTKYILPLEEVREAIRNGRKTRGLSLANSPVVQLLYRFEQAEEPVEIGGLPIEWFS